jgi:hypothetical protein
MRLTQRQFDSCRGITTGEEESEVLRSLGKGHDRLADGNGDSEVLDAGNSCSILLACDLP